MRRLRPWAVGLAVAALVTAAAGSQGAYFSQSWGWIALAFVTPVCLALILGDATAPGLLRLAFAALMSALGVWVALSGTWSLTTAGSMREVERMLVYVALAAAVALVLRRRDAASVVGGIFVASVAVGGYALATRLFQDRFGSEGESIFAYRLSDPIGYWNALGLFAAMGLILGFGLVAHGRRWYAVAFAGASLPVLAATLYFTFSRGGWWALAAGLVVLVALDPRRLRLTWCSLAVAPASIVCVAVASQQDALTTEGHTRSEAVSQGHRLAYVIAGLVLASTLIALAARWISRRVPIPGWAPRALDAALAGGALVAVVVGLVLAGGPQDAWAELESRFEAEPTDLESGNLNDRLLSISGTWRADIIRVAWDAGTERPVLGKGAGSFERLWYERRPLGLVLRDAHSLYAETFAELGVVGIALLGLALLMPLVASFRARRNRAVPPAAAAYVAWLAHAGLDWDWEIVGVTVAALLAGGVALLAAERGAARPLSDVVRWPLLAGSVALTVGALVSLVGNQALFAGREALAREEWNDARKHARHAERLLPWSFEPHIVLGDAAAGLGDLELARTEYRRAVEADESNWVAWLRLAQVARGAERRGAYERVHQLNPRERDLPGESN